MAKGLKSRSAKMPMLEIIITIGIFAVVSVFILELFLSANTLQSRAKDKSKAIVLAESIAETVKSSKTFEEAVKELDLKQTVGEITQGKDGSIQINITDNSDGEKNTMIVYTCHFDENWMTTKEEDTYSVIVVPNEEQIEDKVMTNYKVCVYRLKGYVSIRGEKGSEELYQMNFSHLQDTEAK